MSRITRSSRTSRIMRLAVAATAFFSVLGLARSTPVADAGMVVMPVEFFPPFSDTGTIVTAPPIDDDPNGPHCTFFLADHGGLYFFNGIDSFDEGDRLLVVGQVCLICLTYNVCGIPAAPIVNETVVPVGPQPTLTESSKRALKAVSSSAL